MGILLYSHTRTENEIHYYVFFGINEKSYQGVAEVVIEDRGSGLATRPSLALTFWLKMMRGRFVCRVILLRISRGKHRKRVSVGFVLKG